MCFMGIDTSPEFVRKTRTEFSLNTCKCRRACERRARFSRAAIIRAVLLKACVNGTRRPPVHPALPTTPASFGWAAAASVAAGAGAIHLHVRNEQSESLEPADVARVLIAVRRAIPSTPVGVSTGQWIVQDPEKRHTLVRKWTTLPDFASVNFNEAGSAALADLLMERGIGVEAGLFDRAAAEACVESGLAARCLRLMFEPRGGDVTAALAAVTDMERVLDRAGIRQPRLLHGSGATAWPLIEEAAKRGYDTRAGLEDTLTLPDGSPAPDNAAIVAEAKRRIERIRNVGNKEVRN
jgi:uncharacterized protein (DUF849 family)